MQLLYSPAPIIGESLLGYTIRLSEANGYDTPKVLLRLAFIDRSNRYYLVSHEQDDLSEFSVLSGVSANRLKHLTYRTNIFIEKIRPSLLFSRRARICPLCLAENPYLRKVWDILLITACILHRCILVDECFGCGKSLAPMRTRVCFCACGYDLRHSHIETKAADQIRVSIHYASLLGEEVQEFEDFIKGTSNVALGLPSAELLRTLYFIAGSWDDRIERSKGLLNKNYTCSELQAILNRALSVFDSWPNNFTSYLNQIKTKDQTSLHAQFPDFGRLYKLSYSGKLDFLRSEFSNFVSSSFGIGIHTNQRQNASKSKYVSQTWVVNAGLNINHINQFVDDGLLTCSSLKGAAGVIYHGFERSAVLAIIADLNSTITTDQVVAKLALTDIQQVAALVKNGLLDPVRKFSKVNGNRFLTTAIDKLLSELRVKCKLRPNSKNETFHPYSTLVIGNTRVGIDVFFWAILSGDLIPREINERTGIEGILFSSEEFTRWLRKVSDDHLYLSIASVEKLTQTSRRTLVYFINVNIIKSCYREGYRGRFILKADIDNFVCQFVFATQLAKTFRSKIAIILYCLSAINVYPFSKFNNGRRSDAIFYKIDLEQVNVALLVRSEKRKRAQVAARQKAAFRQLTAAASIVIVQ